ncbi:MAG: hypothetical protein H7210_02375 [Pyrinomonadaceae bacterium]|nr:hypothetical protein [Phycisphaerales bacterium]
MKTQCMVALAAGILSCGSLASTSRADEVFVSVVGNNWFYNDEINMNIDLRIAPGDTVTWEWVGFHNVVSGVPSQGSQGDGRFRSGSPMSKGSFSVTFTEPGVYPYYCQLHGAHGMASTVVVEAACNADWDHSGAVTSQDFFQFTVDFFAESADFNGDGVTSSQDYFDFIAAFFTGC